MIAATLAWIALPAAGLGQDAAAPVSYRRDVLPILAAHCFPCHGPDAGARNAGLRLDEPDAAFAPLRSGRGSAVVAGDPGRSEAWRRITAADPRVRMPPPASKLALEDGEVQVLRRWIEQGARYKSHWAFAPLPDTVPVPPVARQGQVVGDLDRFVLARLEREHLAPAPAADPARWLRRVTLDLTGLPPTPEDIDAFLADHGPDARAAVVDRLLASPDYGERMAVPWLDAARYADSWGYQSDQLCPTWPFRDWVIQAFNQNLPYDRFLTEQLAGDLLPDATRATRVATAFNRLHRQTNEGGSVFEEFRIEYVADRLHTLGATVLGLTLECARCHDHKFDPITQREYYALSAFFQNIDEWGTYNDAGHVPTPSLLLPTPAQERVMADAAQALDRARGRVRALAEEREPAFQAWLARAPAEPAIPGLLARFPLDEFAADHTLRNAVDARRPATTAAANQLVPGRHGQALALSGDDPLVTSDALGALAPWQEFTIAFWVRVPPELGDAVLCHRSDGTDTGFHGTELLLEGGHLRLAMVRFWPGNALAVRGVVPVPRGRWVHVAASHDGTAQAAGLRLFLDGRPMPVEILRDRLDKSPGNGPAPLRFGERFRSRGLKGGALDEVQLFGRALAPIEVAWLVDGHALADALRTRDATALRPYWLAALDPASAQARVDLGCAVRAHYAARDPVVETMVMEELPAPRPAWLLARGRYDAERSDAQRVFADVPRCLPPLPADAPRNRLGLARWLTGPHHPLTARVAVNRLWTLLFGRGLVHPEELFGRQGQEPDHPELLDWLAREFVRSGWDQKALLRRMVLSATYGQDSVVSPALRERDPDNRLLARGPSGRLPAEMVRDLALCASGLLVRTLGGPSVSPYQPGDLWREANDMSPAYHQGHGDDLYRRSLYTVWKRTAPMPNMVAFDAPTREVCNPRRTPTVTPQQAFVLLNDPQFVEAARVLAERVVAADADDMGRMRALFRHLAGRDPRGEEQALLAGLVAAQRAGFAAAPQRAQALRSIGEHKPAPGLDPLDVATWTVAAQAVLNLDAVVWKR